jgi:hypothetical protein
LGFTVAVRSNRFPHTTWGLSEVVAASLLTISVSTADVLAVNGSMPAKEACREWVPAWNGTSSRAWPLGSTAAWPSMVVPSKEVTVPPAVPEAAVTVAVSVTPWPETTVVLSADSVVVVATVPVAGGGEVLSSTETVPSVKLVAARSSLPSPLKSAGPRRPGKDGLVRSLPRPASPCSRHRAWLREPEPRGR